MSQINPAALSVQDICTEALKECGAIGVGQTPLAEDIVDAWSRLQYMLQEWNVKRWLVFHLKTLSIVSNGAVTYTVGPGGQIDTGAGTMRPDKISSAFLRQLTQSQPNQIDYPLELLQSMEDYNKISLKQLKSFPGFVFYDPSWPLGTLYTWPVPQASIYGIYITVKDVLPSSFPSLGTTFNLPYDYYSAILYNLAMRLRPKYGLKSYQGDSLPGLAKASLNALRGANTAIARLQIPADLNRPGVYNIFSDRYY